MTVTAELPLIVSAAALASVALVLSFDHRDGPRIETIRGIAILLGAIGVLAPLVLTPLLDPARSSGHALWQWSAAGGPTVQASYRFDGTGAIGVAVGGAYTLAGLMGISRATRRHPMLPSAILAAGLVFIALAVTEDLIADTVVLGTLASITILAALAVAPLPATTRLAAYLAVGLQLFVLAALLVSRYGGASFRFDAIYPGAVSPDVVLASSAGAALFAGLYPFIPWRFRAQRRAAELEPLRGLVTMPVGIGALLVLLRLLDVTRADLTTIALPTLGPEWRAAVALGSASALGVITWRRAAIPTRRFAIATFLVALAIAYPAIHWSHVILLAALLSVLYAATVSLAIPEEWSVVRYDVTLAAFWVGLALGTPTAIAGSLFILLADGATALAESVWTDPQRTSLVVTAGTTATMTGLIVVGAGALTAGDVGAQGLAIACVVAIGALVLVHVGRRLSDATAPIGLDSLAVVVALGATVLLALLASVPLADAAALGGRPVAAGAANAPLLLSAIVASAALLVVVARSMRPFVPDLGPFAERLRALIAIADPVPAGLAAFGALDSVASRAASTFAVFERRAGVWLATLLIVAILVWSVR